MYTISHGNEKLDIESSSRALPQTRVCAVILITYHGALCLLTQVIMFCISFEFGNVSMNLVLACARCRYNFALLSRPTLKSVSPIQIWRLGY